MLDYRSSCDTQNAKSARNLSPYTHWSLKMSVPLKSSCFKGCSAYYRIMACKKIRVDFRELEFGKFLTQSFWRPSDSEARVQNVWHSSALQSILMKSILIAVDIFVMISSRVFHKNINKITKSHSQLLH